MSWLEFRRTDGMEPTVYDWRAKAALQPLRELASAIGAPIDVHVEPTRDGDGTFTASTPDGRVSCTMARFDPRGE